MIAAAKRFWAWLLHPWPCAVAVFLVADIVIRQLLPETTCRDGWHSASIGLRGACSHHGGVSGVWGGLSVAACLVLAFFSGQWRVRVRRAKRAAERAADRPATGESVRPPDVAAGSVPRCPACRSPMRRRMAAAADTPGSLSGDAPAIRTVRACATTRKWEVIPRGPARQLKLHSSCTGSHFAGIRCINAKK